MNPLWLFAVVAFTSALGSLQAGAVNLAVLRRALQGRGAEARWLALGGSLPEAAYAAIALTLGSWTGAADILGLTLRWAFPVLLAALALYYFFKPVAVAPPEAPTARRKGGAFVSGLLLASANPQLLPFWLAVSTYLSSQGAMTHDLLGASAFTLGAWLGAFGLLWSVAIVGGRWQVRPEPRLLRRLNRITAAILALLALVALVAALHAQGLI